jgi:hypothetical protein
MLVRAVADPGERAQLATAAQALFRRYQERRYLGALWEVRAMLADEADTVTLLAPPELGTAPDDLSDVPWVPPALGWTPGEPWFWGLETAVRTLRTWLYAIRAAQAGEPGFGRPGADAASLAAGARACSVALERLAAIGDALNAAVLAEREALVALDEPGLAARLTQVFAELAVPATIGEVVSDVVPAVRATLADVLGAPTDPGAAGFGLPGLIGIALDLDVAEHALQPPQRWRPTPRFEFARLGLDLVSPLVTLDPAKQAAKLYGLRWSHFGAFARRSWRLHDWVWGRMDGAQHLVDTLVPHLDAAARSALVVDVQRRIVAAEAPTLLAAVDGDTAAGQAALAGGPATPDQVARALAVLAERESDAAALDSPDGRTFAPRLLSAALRLADSTWPGPAAPVVGALADPARPGGGVPVRAGRFVVSPLRTRTWGALRTRPSTTTAAALGGAKATGSRVVLLVVLSLLVVLLIGVALGLAIG